MLYYYYKVHGLSVVSCPKTAVPIEMQLGMPSSVGPRNHVLDGGAHWRHLANRLNRRCAAAMRPYVKLL